MRIEDLFSGQKEIIQDRIVHVFFIVFIGMTLISCVRLNDLLVSRLPSVTAPGDGKKACQYRVLDPFAVHPPFGHVIARSYKGGSVHHCESEMYVCSLCKQSFSTQGSLKRHREPVHRQLAGFACQVCSQRFYRKDVLQRHMKVHRLAVEVRHDLLSCLTDATIDLLLPPPSPSPPPKRHGETHVCNLCVKMFTR